MAEFVAAVNLGSQTTLDTDEVECLLANMVYKVSLPYSHYVPPIAGR